MVPLKPGVHLLIKRTQAPIVPVGIAGAYGAWPRWRSLPTPAPIFLASQRRHDGRQHRQAARSQHFANLPREQALRENTLRAPRRP